MFGKIIKAFQTIFSFEQGKGEDHSVLKPGKMQSVPAVSAETADALWQEKAEMILSDHYYYLYGTTEGFEFDGCDSPADLEDLLAEMEWNYEEYCAQREAHGDYSGDYDGEEPDGYDSDGGDYDEHDYDDCDHDDCDYDHDYDDCGHDDCDCDHDDCDCDSGDDDY